MHHPVQEMLEVFAERLSRYNQENLIKFLKRDAETLVHGDLHTGNIQFGTGRNEGKVMFLDFQKSGVGLVSIEVVDFLMHMDITNYEEVEDILKGKIQSGSKKMRHIQKRVISKNPHLLY